MALATKCLSLPEELIQQILLRLPVKSLVRFKCVCKSWLSLISDPNFAKSHFQLSAALIHRLVSFKRHRVMSIDPHALFHDIHASVKLLLPFLKPSHIKILGSCRGFIMLPDCSHFLLWNPSTGFHKRISCSPGLSCDDGFHLILYLTVCGFGYDESIDDYLIVVAWLDDSDETQLEIFSLRTNSWKKIDVTLPHPRLDPVVIPGLFLNGAIHCLPNPPNKSTILAFNLTERTFSDIPLPLSYPIVGDVSESLTQLGGYLCLCFHNFDDARVEIWVMREYRVQSSWVKYEIFDSSFYPICFAEGGEIIGLDQTGGLAKYNDKGQLLERCANCHYQYDSIMYAESLLSLPDDYESEKKDKGRQVD